MTRVWVVYHLSPARNRKRFAAWLYLLDASGFPRLHGARRTARTLDGVLALIPGEFRPNPRFEARIFHAVSGDGRTVMTALEGLTCPRKKR